MSKAEDLAKELYPLLETDKIGNPYIISYNTEQLAKQEGFVGGYHQAEKDLEPTLEDVEIIINAFLDLCIENKEQENTKRYTDKEWCQEVLKRFKAQKV